MKIFFLDVYEAPDHEKSRIEGFWRLAESEFDATLVRLPLYTRAMDNVAYCNNAVAALEDAEAIVGLGNKHLVNSFENAYNFNNLLKEKIDDGTPFFLQSIRDWERYFHPHGGGRAEHHRYVRELYKHIEVSLTPTKVFSGDAHETDWSGASIWFRSGDGCFINSEILGGNDKVLLSQANLLGYDRGCYPLIEVGPLHQFVGAGDFFEPRPVGERCVVAIERQFKKQNGLVFSGNLALDRTELMGGWQSGFDENEKVVSAILNYLGKRADTSVNRSQEAYRLFSELERQLSRLVHKGLGAYSNRILLLEFIDEEVLRGLPVRERIPDTSYLTYLNLVNLMLGNWDRFKDILQPNSKTLTKKTLQSLNYGVRRYVAHPHRVEFDGYEFGKEDLQKLKVALELVETAFKRCPPS